MFLIVGLGNPELRFAATRHNVGFEAAARLREMGEFESERNRFQALISKGRIGNERVLLARPLTYMNRSGLSVGAICDYFEIPPEKVIVLVDDIHIPFAHLRIRAKGSAGGHNGLKSVIEHLGSEAFPRIRIGVGENETGRDLKDYVLGTFSKDEIEQIRPAIEDAAKAALCIVTDGIEKAMNLYNTRSIKKEDTSV